MSHDLHNCITCQHTAYEEFRHICLHDSSDKTMRWREKFNISRFPSWEYSMVEGTLTFFAPDEKPALVFDMQVVGTTEGSTWEWSWGNKNLPRVCRNQVSKVYEFGKDKNWSRLSALFLEKDEYVGWECVSIANHLLDGLAAYKCPTKDLDTNEAVWLAVLSVRLDPGQSV